MKFKIFLSSLLIVLKLTFFIYPALIISLVMLDPKLKNTGQSELVPMWFKSSSYKYNAWAKEYLETKYAVDLKSSDVASTEWPMFGSVFFLLTAEELKAQNKIDITQKDINEAIDNAAKIISSEDTATWVKKIWKKNYLKTGRSYLENKNVFYRMLLIMGLSSYQKITSNSQYQALLEQQAHSLSHELSIAQNHLADDYPGQCYPNDILWAIAAIKKADQFVTIDTNINDLSKSFINVLSNTISDKIHLPAFQVNSKTAQILQNSRGSGTSGILQFSPFLDVNISNTWYNSYIKHFWIETPWLVGFREFPPYTTSFTDVDTGPIIFNLGSVASLFGIGASKGVGQFNHTVPLTIEAIAFSWPTPFGFLIPSVLSKLSVDSWALGDIALLFSMTRPNYASETIPFSETLPLSIWSVLFIFITVGTLLIYLEIKYLLCLIKKIRSKE